MRRLAVAAALAASSFIPSLADAQAAHTSALLLELPSSARALSLGNTFVAAGTDEAAIFYNPAQLAVIRKTSAGLSVQQWFLSSTLAAAAAATRLAGGTIALGLQVLDYGSSERVLGDPSSGGGTGDPTGTEVSAGDYVASLAYAIAIHSLRVGATAKYVNQRLVDESQGTGAVDFGAALDVHGATVGASVQNIGGEIPIAGGPLPRMVHVGAAVPIHGVGPLDFLGTAEITHTRDEKAHGAGGVEVAYHATSGMTFLGRVGALARPTGAEISPLSFGGGFRAKHLALDYAYESSDVFGATHRVGVRWWR